MYSLRLSNDDFIGFTDKGLKMKQIGEILSLMILVYKMNYKLLAFEDLASVWGVTIKNEKDLKYKIRKELRTLGIDFEEYDSKLHIKKGLPPEALKNGNYVQVYCDLIKFWDIDLIVLFTALEYFKGKCGAVRPSIPTLCKLCGCGRRNKLITLIGNYNIECIDTQGLWKVTSGGGNKKTNTYNLSYINENNEEIYYLSEAFKEGDKTFELPNSIKHSRRVLKRKNRPPREYVEEYENEVSTIGIWG